MRSHNYKQCMGSFDSAIGARTRTLHLEKDPSLHRKESDGLFAWLDPVEETCFNRLADSEAHYDPRAEAEQVLVIVDAVGEGSDEVVGLDQPEGHPMSDAGVEASANVGCEAI
jgi:hypothetical protein